MMPILNVPFRLIYAHNPQREGVLTNRFETGAEEHVPLRRWHDVLATWAGQATRWLHA